MPPKKKTSSQSSPSPSKPNAGDDCHNCQKLIQTIEQLQQTVSEMNKRIQSLEAEVAKSKTEDNSSLITVEDLRETNERVEERTNRQLRKTLVFRGIPEQEQEKSWKETENILAKRIADTLDIEIEDAATMIDRCHRGGNPKYYNDKKNLDLFLLQCLNGKTVKR